MSELEIETVIAQMSHDMRFLTMCFVRPVGSNYRLGGGGGTHKFGGGGAHIFFGGGGHICANYWGGTAPRAPPIPTAL